MFDRRNFLKLSGLTAAGLTLSKNSHAAPPPYSGKQSADKLTSPPLGWNSFDSYGVYLHEKAAMANLEEMAKNFLPFGYNYFVIDGGWFGEYKLVPGTIYPNEKHASDVHINEYGLVQPSKTYFPNGIKPIIDRAHELGLKFGIHLMRGIPRKAVELNLPIKNTTYRARDIANTDSICNWCHYNYGVDMDKPGAQEFYNSLIQQMADWGVDFVKADDLVPFPKEIIGFANAIENCNKEIVFSLSPGGHKRLMDLPYYRRANMLRISSDIWDRGSDLDKGFESWKQYQGTNCNGFFPDLDMIPFGQLMLMTPGDVYKVEDDARLAGFGFKRQCQLTQDQMYTFLTCRALAASPLFIGGDLPTMDAFSRKLLLDREMLACNQNGIMGFQVSAQNNIDIWITPDKIRPGKGWIGVFNRSNKSANVRLTKSDLALKNQVNYRIFSIWDQQKFAFAGNKLSFVIPADGVKFIKYEEDNS